MFSHRRLLAAFLLALALAAVFSLRLAHPELHTDEITYMNAVFESMLQERVFPVQGDGELFLNKPPLSLWAMRLSFELLGPSPFAARLPSVLFAAGTAALLYLFGAALFGEITGLLAAFVFAFTPSPLVTHGLRAATPDALEILLVSLAILGLETWRRHRAGWALAATVSALAATAWVKSPFAAVVFILYMLVTEWPARRAGRGTPRPLFTLGLLIGAWSTVFALWLAVLAADTSPRAVSRRLIYQQYGRRIEGRLGKSHLQGPDFFLRNLAADYGPLLLLPAAAGAVAFARRRREAGPKTAADGVSVTVWAVVAPLLASASASKLTWYAYLSHPGMALLIAVSAGSLVARFSSRRLAAAGALGAVVFVLALRLPTADTWPDEPRHRGPMGGLWELAQRNPAIHIVPGAGLELPRQRDVAYREARFYLRTLLSRPPSAEPGSCRAVLQNVPGGSLDSQIELYRPNDEGVGLWLIDECGGRLAQALRDPGVEP